MKRPWKLLLSFATLAIGFLAVLLIRNREPRYQGKTISEWADIGLRATDTMPWDEPNVLPASNSIHQIGAEALPWIRFTIPNQNDLSQILGVKAASLPTIQSALARSTVRDVERVLFSLYSLGGDPDSAVLQLSTNQLLRPHYLASRIGPSALPILISALTNSSHSVQTVGLLHLVTAWGSRAIGAGPALWHEMESHQNASDREPWLCALAATGYRARELSKLFVAKIEATTSPAIECEPEIKGLALIDSWGSPALISLLDHTVPEVQRMILDALFAPRPQPTLSSWRPEFRIFRTVPRIASPVVASQVDEPAWIAIREASAENRLLVVDLVAKLRSERHSAGRGVRFDPGAVLTRLAKDPDPLVSLTATGALEGFHLLKSPSAR